MNSVMLLVSRVLRWFMLLTSGGYVIAGSFEIREIWIFFVENRAGAYVAKHVHHYDTSSNWTFLIAFGFFLWGLSDAMVWNRSSVALCIVLLNVITVCVLLP